MADKRLIDANTVVSIQVYDDMYEEYSMSTMTVAEALDKWADEGCPPTIDAVEVVRCRECKHNEDDEYCPFVRVSKGQNWLEIVKPPADGFCHKGESMDGGTER